MSYEIMGREVRIPVEVREARSWFASFAVPAARVAEIVAPTGLEPARMGPGRAMASLAFVRYEDGDLDRYHEVAVAFLVEDPTAPKNLSEASTPGDGPSRPPSGARAARPGGPRAGGKGVLIHRLPVDQEFTCAAGREIWGFPKFVTPIDITEGTSARSRFTIRGRGRQRPSATEGSKSDTCTLTVDGKLALSLTMRHGIPAPMRETALDAFSFRDGVLRRTRWELRGRGSRMRPGGMRVELGRGEIAEELRSLGFPRHALMSGRVDHVAMTFQAAEIVTADAAVPA